MFERRAATLVGVILAMTAVVACSNGDDSGADTRPSSPVSASSETVESVVAPDTGASAVDTTVSTGPVDDTVAEATVPPIVTLPTATTDEPTATSDPGATTTTSDPGPTTTVAIDPETTSTTIDPAVTTTTMPALDVFDPFCVVEVAAGDSLSLIADRFDDETVNPETLRIENGIVGDNIDPGDYLDVCIANGLDDITGEQRLEGDEPGAESAEIANVKIQQTRLNELFAGLGTPELLVDGISGPVTRQRLCAARLAFGLPTSTADMVAGSAEEQLMMAAPALPIPFTSSVLSERWILIDRTCQIMFAGEGLNRLVFVFPTSTGSPGFETRDQDRSRAFRYNPALANGGWHNSSTYPVADDNPLNGNMFKPIYFDRGQAIHGANNVPTSPQSKGCARLRVQHQTQLIDWLGLGDITTEIGNANRINVTVNVQGVYVPS